MIPAHVKHPAPSTYRADTLFPRVERAVAELLRDARPVSAPEVFVRMGMLTPAKLLDWRQGHVPYLERVIQGSLGKINRVLRIISLHAHDLQFLPAPSHAAGVAKFKGRLLRFSKTGDPGVEDCARRVFVLRPPKRERQQRAGLAEGDTVLACAVEQRDAPDEGS